MCKCCRVLSRLSLFIMILKQWQGENLDNTCFTSLLKLIINNSDIWTLQHPVNNAFMKIFNTKSNDVVHECQIAFGFRTVREQAYMRKIKFLTKYIKNDNLICSFLERQAISEIRALRVGYADTQRIWCMLNQ